MTLTFTASVAGCILTYGLEFWDTDQMIWVPWTAATYGFVPSYTNTASATITPTYSVHKWSEPPSYKITAKLWVFSEETA